MERIQADSGPTLRAEPFAASTIGKKVVMAVTGFILFGFVVAHMIGNLQAYMGPEAMNAYAVWLRELMHGSALWIARAVLLLSVILHIWSATALTWDNVRARPVGYRRRAYDRSTYASRTMVWSGPILLLFIVYHLLHFTFGTVHPSFVEGDVYHNFVAGFQVVPVSVFYIVAMLALGYHLYHGIWSMLQTLGLSHPRYNFLRHGFAGLMTAIVVVGNISFPLAVLTGVIR
ncbi:MAG TPA: succinate dehydrogenase cytochrome b subunit [Candidatus Binatia bacterium]|nr:succinate dehydrogenase cytochrome b subunit [Candidatus Binatia bacterium]